MTSPIGDQLVLRPAPLARVIGWCVVGVGLAFGAAGFAAPDDTETLVTMVLGGLVFMAVGLTIATAAASVSPSEIRYRNGLQRRTFLSDNVTGVTVGPGSGTPPPRLAYVVHRAKGRPVRLIGVQRWRTDSTAEAMGATARAVESILGFPRR